MKRYRLDGAKFTEFLITTLILAVGLGLWTYLIAELVINFESYITIWK